MSASPTLTAGLTGGLASGKSTVARLLGERGAAVIDADRVVDDLYRPGAAGARALAAALDDDVLGADGAVDRTELVARIRSGDGVLDLINSTVHPLVHQAISAWLAEVTAPVAVIEAALMVETGSYRRYDCLLVVRAEPAQQLTRAAARGMAPERARTLLAAQADLSEKCAVADLVIDNSGSEEDLEAGVERAWRWLTDRASSTAGSAAEREYLSGCISG